MNINKKLMPEGINKLQPIILYDSSEGAQSVTLKDSAKNYSYIEIFYRTNDNFYNSVKVSNPNGKDVLLIGAWINTAGTTTLKLKIASINETNISPSSSTRYGDFGVAGSTTKTATDYIYITKVLGYK